MLTRKTPPEWRQGFSLCRRRLEMDSMGDPAAVYDMEHPDLIVEDGAEEAICWQNDQSWKSSGRLTNGCTQQEMGELPSGVVEGCVFSDLELTAFDRLVIRGELYEIRNIQHWPGHRMVQLQRIG